MSEGELQQKVCAICPNCVEEPCRLDANDFCATCTDILKFSAGECTAARIDELQYLEHAREEAIGPDIFISKYITKRVKKIVAPKAAPHDHNAPDGAERNV